MTATLTHPAPPAIDASDWIAEPALSSQLDEQLVRQAGRATHRLPTDVHDALVEFVDAPHRSGAMLLRHVPIGSVPPTPLSPDAHVGGALTSELALLTVARQLGQPVGYGPEHGGRVIQDIVPVAGTQNQQVSTSSDCDLMFHTETAFHPHRPRYLLLLCLRGDPAAATLLVSIHHLLDLLDDETIAVMFEPRFATAVDASFLVEQSRVLGAPRPLLEGTVSEPTFVFDADLMVGTDPEAESVLDRLRQLIVEHQTSVVLEPGDLLVVDNHLAVHGRSRFQARFDGTDRWLQRAFVVADLAPSAADRDGRVITTRFDAAKDPEPVR